MNTSPSIHPTSALLSPLWLVATLVLAVNDHIIKSAMPGVVSGKLSDVAGMIVAPTLLACVLAVRSRGGLLACHVAVGVVFGSLKISGTVAGWWPWRVVVDPTDLLALPVLALAWRGLLPAMKRPLGGHARTGLATVTAGLGLLVCAATSPQRQPHPPDRTEMMMHKDGLMVTFSARMQGFVEVRCDDGTQVSQPMDGSDTAVLSVKPGPGVECKLRVPGVPGSFGPVTATTRRIDCRVATDRLECGVTETK
jgi:hypothetical protein